MKINSFVRDKNYDTLSICFVLFITFVVLKHENSNFVYI